ncbi:hypothetical protein QO010_003220 [Caulobacter ginsengisoli]|jgi:hypothetical protein|uniref:Exopolysaccharide biosynthesis protein exod n=1 Tax=Caulobacter ginsengisoli TaxID=400775 RepID=A0ABU0IWA3_9CAUL|nr:exopolysaccharide biosynthesis protein [Caulobacter ginsengisoli]MDQ0465433.1 hypothetical protein [Caulobacter ginsengisoli]
MTLVLEAPDPAAPHPPGRRLSRALRDIRDEGADSVAVHELTTRMGERAFGALLALFSLVNLLPAPPGSGVILAAPLVLIGAQAALGARAPWLPRFVRHRRISQPRFGKALKRTLPALDWLEAFSRPRLTFLFNPPAERLIGLVCAILAIVSMIPIPFAHMAPAIAVGIYGLALMQRDGVLLIVAIGLTLLSAVLFMLGAGAVVTLLHHLSPIVSGGVQAPL